VKYLIPHHIRSVAINRHITVAQIRCNEQELSGNVISYLAAHRTKEAILEQLDGKEQDEFSKLNHLTSRINQASNELTAYFTTDPSSNRFDSFLCIPLATRKAWKYMRPFIAVDACHCTSRYKQTLFLAAGIDGNGAILPLMWGIFQGENFHNWGRFLNALKSSFFPHYPANRAHLPHHLVIMSDRQKGLKKALKDVFPTSSHEYCCQHIAANVQSRYGIAAKDGFWAVAYARTEADYEKALTELRTINQHAAIYVRKLYCLL
jgi:hypothetical protein